MAIDSKNNQSSGKRLKIGANVTIATLFVVGIVVVLQTIAFSLPGARLDMTSTRINSLSDATEKLLSNLDTHVRLTSLYFETDLEEEDQPLYRRTVKDLLGLYESTQRSKITMDTINPLSDHDKFKEMVARLRSKERFSTELEPYKVAIDLYKNEMDLRMRDLVRTELESIGTIGNPMSGQQDQASLGQIQSLFTHWTTQLEELRTQLDALTTTDNPQDQAAVSALKNLYREFGKSLTDIPRYALGEVSHDPDMPAEVSKFLRESGNRYSVLALAVESESTKLQNLEPLNIDDLLRQIQPNSNSIIVETDGDAMIVDFASIWPVLDPSRGSGRVQFKDRGFKGEEQLTSAILRATHQEQTAVVFVRWGGMSLLMGGMIPGQPPAPFANIKRKLENVNFIVDEWDVKASATPPDIDPVPTRTIYVVFKPSPPPRGPMGQMSQEPPFTDADREKLINAMGENPRALFIAGWAPGPFGPIPGTYEYNDYLKDNWGIHVDTSSLLIETTNTAPGEYKIMRRDFYNMYAAHLDVGDHEIVSGTQAGRLSLPWCAPLELVDSGLEGVDYNWLVSMGQIDGVWGVKNIQVYQNQMIEQEYMVRADGDLEGPFNLAVAATKGDAKLVVVSSREFAVDQVAFAQGFAQTSRGFTIRSINPGNLTLLVNSLHWLNDKSEYMNIGKPIDAGVLEIENKSSVTVVRVLTIFVWPAMALACGGLAWWVRRR